MSDPIAPYRKQSPVTCAHAYQAELDRLPEAINALIATVNGLMLHFENDKAAISEQLYQARKHEVDSRWVSSMLARILSLDERALDQPRPPERRLLSTCRDTAVLLCAFMRHKGMAARVRFGFVHDLYQRARPMHNHVVVEYWNGSEWQLAESMLAFAQGADRPFSADKLPPGLFITASQAWQQVQSGAQAVQAFSGYKLGIEPSVRIVRGIVLSDLAALAGYEPLIWDQWGCHYQRSGIARGGDPGVLDRLLARAIATDTCHPTQCRQLLAHFQQVAGIAAGTVIHSFSPVLGRYSITV